MQIRIINIQLLHLLKLIIIAMALGSTGAFAQLAETQESSVSPAAAETAVQEAPSEQADSVNKEPKAKRPEPVFSSGYLAQTVIGLVFVVILMFGLLWVMKRAGLSPGHRANGFYKVLNVSSLGPKEKIALIEVGDTWLVVGMTQHSINTLHSMPKDSLDVSTTPAKPSEAFAKMLEKLKTPQAKA